MATIVEMPRLSDTMEEGTVAEWLKSLGDTVDAGDALADIETDKAIMTFESFDEGVLLHTFVANGDTVPLGTPIAILGDAGEDVAALVAEHEPRVAAAMQAGPAPAPAPEPRASEPPQAAEATKETEPAAPPAAAPEPAVIPRGPAPIDPDGLRVKASPLARRIAAQRGVDLTTVAGTGPGGRIIKRDVEGLDATRRVFAGGRGASTGGPPRADEVVRVTQMRKTIAKRLVESKQSAPHYYLTIDVDASRLVAFRAELNRAQDARKISYNDLIMKACAIALADHPGVNVGWEGSTIRRFGGVHLGFAVALEQGLITPVIRNAERLSLFELAAEVRTLAARAREMRLDSADYTGNSFTVSNLGMFGITEFTAIINPPAACILAVGGLRAEPVVVDGQLAAGHRMKMTMSCDHRAVDGAVGAAFLKDLRAVLDNPMTLLLD